MKKLTYLISVIFLGLVVPVAGLSQNTNGSAVQKHKQEKSADWSPQLKLDSAQQLKLKAMENEFQVRLTAARSSAKTGNEKSEEIRKVYQWRDESIKQVLTNAQNDTYRKGHEKIVTRAKEDVNKRSRVTAAKKQG